MDEGLLNLYNFEAYLFTVRCSSQSSQHSSLLVDTVLKLLSDPLLLAPLKSVEVNPRLGVLRVSDVAAAMLASALNARLEFALLLESGVIQVWVVVAHDTADLN